VLKYIGNYQHKLMKKSVKKSSVYFYILIRSWDSFKYFNKCIDSVLGQSYKDFKILFVDDASNYDQTQLKIIKDKLKNHITVFNKVRKYSLFNAYTLIYNHAKNDNAVVLNLDGDDWLSNKNVLKYLSGIYSKTKCWFTYGECYIWNGKELAKSARSVMPYLNIPYPKKIVASRQYRRYTFLPLHPRSWKVWLFKKIKRADFLRPDGSWLRFAEDQAIFLPMLELAIDRLKVIRKPLYVYNTATNFSDVKKSLIEVLKDELIIRKKKPYEEII